MPMLQGMKKFEIRLFNTPSPKYPKFFVNEPITYSISQYITHVHFYKIIIKYVDANLDAPDNAISGNEPFSEMHTSLSQILK